MILTIHVKPRAKKKSVEWVDEDTLKVSVTAPAEKGRANEAVIEAIAKELGIKKSAVEIIRGHTTRIKQVHLLLPSTKDDSAKSSRAPSPRPKKARDA